MRKERNHVDTDWNGIVRDHGATVFGAAWRILGNAGDADDIVQEVFLEVQQLNGSQAVEKWAPFLRRVATFRALDRLRRQKATVPIDESRMASSADDPVANAIGNELEARLRASIAGLPKQQAAVFCLRYFEDLTYDQIASALQISSAAVATALNKARGRLKTMLVDSREDE